MLGRSKSLRKSASLSPMPIEEEGSSLPPLDNPSVGGRSSSPAPSSTAGRRLGETLHAPTGLVNDGNTCFLNSVFQSVIHTPPLNSLLTPNDMLEAETLPFSPAQTLEIDRQRCPALMSERNEHLDLMPLSASFVEAAGRSWRTELKGLEKVTDRKGQGLKTFLYNMSKKHDQYGDYDQQDSHEFLRHMLDSIRMEEVDVIKRLKANRPDPNPETASVNSSVSEATSAASSIPVPHLEPPIQKPPPTSDTPAEERDDLVSFVDLLFGGRLASMIVCGTCKSVSHTYEDFMDLSMSMPGEAPKEKKRDRLRSMASKLRAKLSKPDNFDNDSSAVASDDEDDGPPTDDHARSMSARRLTSTDEGPKRVPGGRRMTVDQASGPPSSSNIGRRNSILSAFGGGRKKSVSRRSSAAQSEAVSLASRPPSPGHSEDGEFPISPLATPFSTSALLAQPDPTSPEAKFPKLRQSQAQYISQILGGPSLSASTVQHLRSLSMSMPAPPSPASSDGASGALPPLPGSPVPGVAPSPMPAGQNGLMDALRQFTSVEVLDGDNAFACKKCWRFDHPRRDGKPWRRGGERPDDSDDDDEQDDAARVESGPSGVVDGSGGSDQPLAAIQDVDDDVEAAAHARGTDIQALADLHLNGDEPPTEADLVRLDSKLAEIDGLPMQALTSPTAAAAVLSNEIIPTATFGGPPHPHGPQHAIPSIIETPFSPTEEKPAPDMLMVARPAADGSSLNPPPRSSRAHQLTKTLSRGKSYMKHSNPEFQVVEDSDSDNSDASSIGGTDDEAATAVSGATTPGSRSSPAKGPKSVMRRAFKRYLIVNPPPILVFHLKRFEQIFGGKGFSPFGGFTTNFKKLDGYVSFPLTVDIAPFFAPARVGAPATSSNLSAKAKKLVTDIPDSVNYELSAIVVHLGSMGGGHYISYVLSSPLAPPPPHANSASPEPPSAPSEPAVPKPDSPAPVRGLSTSVSHDSFGSARSTSVSRTKTPVSLTAGQDPRVWFYCSDTIVKQVSVEEVLRARAYLLFYQRVI